MQNIDRIKIQRRSRGKGIIFVQHEDGAREAHRIQTDAQLRVADGEMIEAGDPLTEGTPAPADILRFSGHAAACRYLRDEIQDLFRSQNLSISDQHLEIVIREMLRHGTVIDGISRIARCKGP
jgi:DNA-directed RNA polymerase subunit beta'